MHPTYSAANSRPAPTRVDVSQCAAYCDGGCSGVTAARAGSAPSVDAFHAGRGDRDAGVRGCAAAAAAAAAAGGGEPTGSEMTHEGMSLVSAHHVHVYCCARGPRA